MKELEGLFKKEVFYEPVSVDQVDKDARVINSKFVRRVKGDFIKPRSVVQDCKGMTTYLAEELFASTPADNALRVQLSVESVQMHQDNCPRFARVGDISQAFVHALIDKKIFIVFPRIFHTEWRSTWMVRCARLTATKCTDCAGPCTAIGDHLCCGRGTLRTFCRVAG